MKATGAFKMPVKETRASNSPIFKAENVKEQEAAVGWIMSASGLMA